MPCSLPVSRLTTEHPTIPEGKLRPDIGRGNWSSMSGFQGRRGAGEPQASRTPGPRAPHLVLAASAAAVPRRSVHGSGLAEGAREARGSSQFPVGSFTFGPAVRPSAGTTGLLVRLKFASGAPHRPLHWG